MFSKVLFYKDRTSSVANFGAGLRFFHVGSVHTVLFHNQRLASREKCVMTDFVRLVLKDIFVVSFVKLKFCFVFVFEVWVRFLIALHTVDLYLLSNGQFPSLNYFLPKTDLSTVLMTDDRPIKNF